MAHVQNTKTNLPKTEEKEGKKETMKCPGLIFFFPPVEKKAVHNHLVWRIYTRKQCRPQNAISPFSPGKYWWLSMIDIASAVKTQCSVRMTYQILFHGFKKDLGPGL